MVVKKFTSSKSAKPIICHIICVKAAASHVELHTKEVKICLGAAGRHMEWSNDAMSAHFTDLPMEMMGN